MTCIVMSMNILPKSLLTPSAVAVNFYFKHLQAACSRF